MKRWFVSLAMLAATTLSADTLVLRDGRRIQGQLISVHNGLIEFEDVRSFGSGRPLRFDRNEVLGIEFDRVDQNTGRFGSPGAPGGFGGPGSSDGRRPSGLRERQVMVLANVRWVDTGIDLQPGQDVYFESSGEVRWGQNRRDGPGGEQNSPYNANRPMPNRPAAALVGRVGTNSNDYFFIGDNRGPIRMRAPGRLFLAVNDDVLEDNSGSFRVIVYY
jgi:hypothetical protein